MSIAEEAKAVYRTLKDRLEADHLGQFVTIEPTSKSYFVGETFLEAALAAKEAIPNESLL